VRVNANEKKRKHSIHRHYQLPRSASLLTNSSQSHSEFLNFNLQLRPYPHRQSITIIPLNGRCISPGGAPTHRRWHFNLPACKGTCSCGKMPLANRRYR
jgi:hypothetical protein